MRTTSYVCVAFVCVLCAVTATETATLTVDDAETQQLSQPPPTTTVTAPLTTTTTSTATTTVTAATTPISGTFAAPIVVNPAAAATVESSSSSSDYNNNNEKSESNRITTFVPTLNAEDSENLTKIAVGPAKKTARYEGDQVLRVFTVNSKHRKKIKEIERDGKGQRWGSNTTSVDLYVKKDKVNEVKNALGNASMDFRVLVDDVQRAVDEENPPLTSEELNEFASRKGHRLTFDHYHRMADVHGFLDYFASIKSDFVTVRTVGQSVEGRPIKLIKISSGKPNATAFWIDGGTHAREWITVATVSYIINELIENRDSLDRELLNIDFYIVPLMNPDGYEYSHEQERLWRKNRRRNYGAFCVGTDLNRNWGYEWGGQGSGKYPCQETYGGTGPLSEPETRSVADFILQRAHKFKGFVTFHSYGQYILYPWGHAKRLPADAEDMDRVGRIAAAAMKQSGGATYTVGNSAALLYAASGGADDWAKGAAKIKYSYTIEQRDNGRYGFILPASFIKTCGKESFAAIKAIAKEQKWQLREKHLLEENRQLKQNIASVVSAQEFDSLKTKLNTANEMINNLKQNFSKISTDWSKKEMKLMEERNQLRYKLQNAPKMVPPDVERLQEQVKDAQEANVKLKLDLDAYKDKCVALENLCADLKKVIMDEQIVDRVYANDNIPASVKQFLASSSSSVINTLSHMFGCLSRNASRNRHAFMTQKEIFTTNESSVMIDPTRNFDQTDLIKELLKEKEQIKKENLDLNRQVKELEKIVRRRAHPNFSNVSEILKSEESRLYEKESETIKNLKRELLEKQHVIIDLKNQLIESKANYDQNLLSLQGKIVNIQEESMKMKEELDKNKRTIPVNHGPKCKRKGRSCDPPSSVTRNFRIELTAKEREIQQLSKQLDEVKRMNKKLMKDKENYYLSSKEQSADDIQLVKKYDNPYYANVNDRSNCEKNDLGTEEGELNLVIGETKDCELNGIHSFEMNEDKGTIEVENDDFKVSNEASSGKESNSYEQISKKVNFLESEHQNMQQVICDMLKLLMKGELLEKLNQNRYSTEKGASEQDELSRFVTALQSIATNNKLL